MTGYICGWLDKYRARQIYVVTWQTCVISVTYIYRDSHDMRRIVSVYLYTMTSPITGTILPLNKLP